MDFPLDAFVNRPRNSQKISKISGRRAGAQNVLVFRNQGAKTCFCPRKKDPVAMKTEPILTIEDVAQRLRIEPRTVYELTRRRARRPLPVLRVGKFLRFRWSHIEKWLDESLKETR